MTQKLDMTPLIEIAEALQNLVEVAEKTTHMLPDWQQEKAQAACERARKCRIALRMWIDDALE